MEKILIDNRNVSGFPRERAEERIRILKGEITKDEKEQDELIKRFVEAEHIDPLEQDYEAVKKEIKHDELLDSMREEMREEEH